jgi:hypothetical protein
MSVIDGMVIKEPLISFLHLRFYLMLTGYRFIIIVSFSCLDCLFDIIFKFWIMIGWFLDSVTADMKRPIPSNKHILVWLLFLFGFIMTRLYYGKKLKIRSTFYNWNLIYQFKNSAMIMTTQYKIDLWNFFCKIFVNWPTAVRKSYYQLAFLLY